MQLTDLQCRTFKPKTKPYKKADGRGLFIFIKPNGSKLWRYKYRIHSKEKLYSIGSYPQYSLAQVREIHRKLHKMVSEGIDPLEYEKDKKQKELQEKALTFSIVTYQWLEKHKPEVKPQTYRSKASRIEKYILPFIGHVPIRDLNAQHILSMIKTIEKRGTFEISKRVRQHCSQILSYALACGLVERDYTLDIKGAVIKHKVKHQPALTQPKQVKEFLDALKFNDARLHKQTKLALKLLMLTFVRPVELSGVKWEEFNFTDNKWIIPPGRMKMGKEHIVPLSKQSIHILDQLKELNGDYEHVFINQRDPHRSMSRDTFSNAIRLLGFQGRHTGHGFRAMAETLIQEELEYDFSIVDRQLAHKPKGSLGATYDRAQFLEKRTVMMQDWADYIDRLKFSN